MDVDEDIETGQSDAVLGRTEEEEAEDFRVTALRNQWLQHMALEDD